MEPEDARSALDEVRIRDRQVRVELSRQRPTRRATLLMVSGYYLAMAGLDFPFPVPLTFAAGAALLIAGHLAQARRSASGNVRSRRESWRPGNLVRTAAWLVAITAAYALTRSLLVPVVPPGLTSVLAAVPSTLLFAAWVHWQYRAVYGPAPAAQEAPAAGVIPARTTPGQTPPQTGDR